VFRDIEASILFAEKMTDSVRMCGCTVEIDSFAVMVNTNFICLLYLYYINIYI
jgi:hypothetical protein